MTVYAKIYKASDDSVVTEAPGTANAVAFTLRADLEESDSIRLYALAEATYEVTTGTVTPTGTSATKWQLAPDSGGSEGSYEDAGDPLVLGTIGASTKVHFWAKALSANIETPIEDKTVTLVLSGVAGAAP